MPPMRALAAFPFAGGLQTKMDPKSPRLAGSLLTLINGVFTRPDRIDLRNGYRNLGTGIAGGGSITQGLALTSYLDELVLCDPTSLYSYNASSDDWVRKGRLTSLACSTTPVCRNTTVAKTSDGAVHSSGLGVYSWQDIAGNIRCSVVDTNTGSTIQSNVLLAPGSNPKTIVAANTLCIYYVSTGTPILTVATLPISTPTAAFTLTALTSGSGTTNSINSTTPCFDVCLWPSPQAATSLYVVFNNATPTTGGTTLQYFVLGDPLTVLSQATYAEGALILNVFPDLNGPVVLSYLIVSATQRIHWHAYEDFTTGSLAIPVIISGVVSGAGALPIGTYAYRVSAIDGAGRETAASAPFTVPVLANSSLVTLTWGVVAGAATYNVYGRIAGVENLLFNTVSTSGIDDGTITPAPPPAPNFPTPFLIGTGSKTVSPGAVGVAVIALGGVATGPTPDWQVLYTIGALAPSQSFTATFPISAFTGGAITISLAGLILVSKPYLYLGTPYALLLQQSPLQSTYFIADATGFAIAKFLYSVAASGLINVTSPMTYPVANLTEVTPLTSSEYSSPLVEAVILTTVEGATQYTYGVTAYFWDFADPIACYSRAVLAETLLFSGGFVWEYDGANVGELGVHLAPEGVTGTAIGGGNLSAGTYSWVVCYERTDNRGHVQRSRPSVAVTKTVTAGQGMQLEIPYLQTTAHDNVVAQVYRTIADDPNNPPVYYLDNTTTVAGFATQTNAPTINRKLSVTPNQPTFLWQDLNLTDTQLKGNALLYTDGGVLADVPPNAVTALTVWDSRVWAVDAANRLMLWMTKQVLPGTPPEFAQLLTYNVDARAGRVEAIGYLDQSLVMHGDAKVFYTAGQGPDDTGSGGYPDCALTTTESACINQRSLGNVPAGVFMQTRKGIYLLDHSYQASYAGAPVQKYNSEVVTSCCLIPTTNEIRFTLLPSSTTPTGTILVFDTFANQWGTQDPTPGIDATIWQDTYCYLRPNGVVSQETIGEYTDNGAFISLELETSNLQLNGQQGWQRAWEFNLLGECGGVQNLLIEVAYDFSPAPSQSDTVAPGAPSTWGSDSTWGGLLPGDALVWGGDWIPYQWRVFCVQSNCQALRIHLKTLLAPGGVAGIPCSFSGIMLRYKPRDRTNPVRPSRIV